MKVDSLRKPAFIILGAELRFDMSLGDIERGRIRDRAFQAIADLDEHLAIVDENKEHRAVATIFLSDAPRLRNALRVVRDIGVGLHFAENRHDDLVRSVALELRELLVETRRGAFRNNAGVIVEVTIRLRRNDFGRDPA